MLKRTLIFAALTSTLVSACGGDGASTPVAKLATVDILEGDNSALADDIPTPDLQRVAALHAAQGITTNLSGFETLNNAMGGSSNSFSANSSSLLFNDDSGTNRVLNSSLSVFNDVFDDSNNVDGDYERLLEASLGLGESSNASVAREGNLITIDPDDAEICAGETFFLGGSDDMDIGFDAGIAASTTPASELNSQVCQQMASHLSVQLTALTELSGTIIYLFDQLPFFEIGYGPVNASYELTLETLQVMQHLSDQLSGITSTTQTMSGAVRVTASVSNSQEGHEAGSTAFVVSEAISIVETDGSRFSMAPATVFAATHDEAAGTAHMELDMGALQITTMEPAGEFSATPTETRISLAGLSAIVEFTDNGELVTVSQLGFPYGPLSVVMDNDFSLSLSLTPLGFSLTDSLDELALNSALNATVTASGLAADSVNFNLSLSAPAHTKLDTETDHADQLVKSGGPLTLSYQAYDAAYSQSGSVILEPGSCQSSNSDGIEDQAIYNCDSF